MDIPAKEQPREITALFDQFKSEPASYWANIQSQNQLRLFREMSERVPAYKKFLEENKFDPESVKDASDLKRVPRINKKNYLRKYPIKDLCWDGSLTNNYVFTSTSGSTGEPVYFPRSRSIDLQSSIIHQLFYQNFGSKDKSTLVVVCFGMGIWIGGLITYQAFEHVGSRGNPISIITPGINKKEIFRILETLAPNFDQVVMTGYAPFIKDIVDEACDRNIDIKKLNLKLLFAAEAFTDNLRAYLAERCGIENSCLETMNIYGSADIGTMAFETPISILARQLATKNPDLFQKLFTEIKKTPTFAQFNPMFTMFDAEDGELLLSGDSALPLFRYAIGDHGGVYSADQVFSKYEELGIDLRAEAEKSGIADYVYNLPFVYVYERVDFSTTLYGLQIYPEMVKEAILKDPMVNYFTGKLVLETIFNENHDQKLIIHLELKPNISVDKCEYKTYIKEIVNHLREVCSEYRELSNFLGDRSWPDIVCWPAEHPDYFKQGIKQQWVKK